MTDFAKLTAADIMHTKLLTATPEQPLDEVRERMVEARVSAMPVLVNDRVVGVVSNSDFLRIESLVDAIEGQVAAAETWENTQADGFDHTGLPDNKEGTSHTFQDYLKTARVKDVMRRQIFHCAPGDSISNVAKVMSSNHIHRLVVLEGDKLVGIISSMDMVKLLAGD